MKPTKAECKSLNELVIYTVAYWFKAAPPVSFRKKEPRARANCAVHL